jgi:uncharacterized protein (UPF0332 family)
MTNEDRKELKEQIQSIVKKAKRQVGDYGFYIDITEEEILEDVKSTENFLEKIKEYLKQKGFL